MGSNGFVRNIAQDVFGQNTGDMVVGGANLVSSGVGLARPVLRQGTKKLFRNIPSDYVPAATQATRAGLGSEALVAGQGIYDTSERICRP